MYNKNYISVGIDVGSAFSFMTIVAPDGSVIQNPFKITHNKPDSLERAVSAIGLSDDIPVSQFPTKLVLELRSLTRKYYDLTDERSAHINKLKGDLHTVFPQYLDIFCDVTGKTSTMILRQYGTPDKILRGHKKTMIEKKAKASRNGISKATERYEKLCAAATATKSFGCQIDSIYFNISLTLDLIEKLDLAKYIFCLSYFNYINTIGSKVCLCICNLYSCACG